MELANRNLSAEYGSVHNINEYPVLPGKMQRSQVADCLRELAGPLWGMKSGRLMTLLAMMDKTRPQDWVQTCSEPVCYAQQTQLALSLGKTERAIRNDEVEFERLGLIEKRTGANGARARAGQLGLVFSPLIAMMPRLVSLASELRGDRDEKEGIVRRRSHQKKRAQEAIRDLQGVAPDLPEVIAAFEEVTSWPSPASLRRMSLTDVIGHYEAAKNLVDNLLDLLAKQHKTSGRPEPDFRHYIQDTTQEESMYCNASLQKRTGLQPDADFIADTPHGVSDCLESKYEAAREAHKCKFSEKLTPKRLYDLCAFDMRMHLDLALKGRGTILHHDFVNAAYDCALAMGVNHSAWVDAIETMGEFPAALCIILIDANRDHPVSPIRSPGGTLRAMTRKHSAGELNIFGGLIGLSQRKV